MKHQRSHCESVGDSKETNSWSSQRGPKNMFPTGRVSEMRHRRWKSSRDSLCQYNVTGKRLRQPFLGWHHHRDRFDGGSADENKGFKRIRPQLICLSGAWLYWQIVVDSSAPLRSGKYEMQPCDTLPRWWQVATWLIG